ncbi:MAG: DUF4157 domain-containing protein [Tistlia sp.]|uniref:eCIS core domain-containing protein n=1 Tax=Tistlia sp. TaxID=3057121 RepID=UPI0034A1A4AC
MSPSRRQTPLPKPDLRKTASAPVPGAPPHRPPPPGVGNQAMIRLMTEPGAARDAPAERQAEEVARRATSLSDEALFESAPAAPGGGWAAGAPATAGALAALRTRGPPHDPATRAYFEQRFGQDFRGVRVHADGRASQAVRDLSARAYTVGSHIAFADGRYSPASGEGRRLLAHELAHVVQQAGGAQAIQRAPDPDLEEEEEEAPALSGPPQPGLPLLSDPRFLCGGGPCWEPETDPYHSALEAGRQEERKLEEARLAHQEETRHDNALLLARRLEEHRYAKSVILELLGQGGLLHIVRHFGCDLPSWHTRPETYRTCVRTALLKYDTHWREARGLYQGAQYQTQEQTGRSSRYAEERRARDAFDAAWTSGLGHVTGSFLGAVGAQVASLFTDDPRKIAAAAAFGAGLSNTAGNLAQATALRNTYTPEVVGPVNPVGAWRYAGPARTTAPGPGGTVAPAPQTVPMPRPDASSPEPAAIPTLRPPSTPMRRPPGGGERGPMGATENTVLPYPVSRPAVEALPRSSPPLGGAAYSSDPAWQPPAGETRQRAATGPWLAEQLEKVSDPAHPLHVLTVEVSAPGGGTARDWRTTSFETKAGETLTGRYAGSEEGPTVQVGHRDAFASRAPEKFMLEDADFNQLSGQAIESRGAYSYKVAVLVGPPGKEVPIELGTLLQLERLGRVPLGTALNAPKMK